MTLTPAEELVLVATDKTGSVDVNARSSLDNGIAGARLLELALAGRIALEGGKIAVADATPTGDPLADEALEAIAASQKPRSAKHWVGRLAQGGVRKRVFAGLDERGVLAAQRGKFLGLVPRTRKSRSIRSRSGSCVRACAPPCSARSPPRTRARSRWPRS